MLFCLQHLETHTFRLHTLSDLARLWTCVQEANYPSHELSWTVQIQRIAYQPLPEVYTNHTVCYLAFFQLSYLNRVGSTQLYHFILLLVYPYRVLGYAKHTVRREARRCNVWLSPIPSLRKSENIYLYHLEVITP